MTVHARAPEEPPLSLTFILVVREYKHRLTRSSFAKNFKMAGKEGDVFEKNSRLLKNWKVLFSFLFMFASLLQQELCILRGFTAFTDILHG